VLPEPAGRTRMSIGDDVATIQRQAIRENKIARPLLQSILATIDKRSFGVSDNDAIRLSAVFHFG